MKVSEASSATLSSKLGIKPRSKVCLVRANQEILAKIRQETNDIQLITDKVERGCDVVLYWIQPEEDIKEKMLEFQNKIKGDGRIWVIMPKKETARQKNLAYDWNQMQKEILKTHLVDNKIASINEEEYGTQFVIRKEYRR